MKKSVFLAVILLVFTLQCKSQNQKSLLWKITGNGLSKPSYIFGTMHLMCPSDFVLSDATKEAFNKAEQVYLEIDFDDPNMMMEMQQKMMLPQGKTLKSYLKDADYKLLNDFFTTKTGTGMPMFEHMKPLVLVSLVDMALLSCPIQSYELTFSKIAGESKKEIRGLETIAFQMSIFDTIPYEKQLQQLVDMVRRKDLALKEFNEMVTLYKDQDIDGLLKLTRESQWNFNEYEDIFINNRNASWIPIIANAAKEKSTFIAVGAGHLGGDKGVLQLLRKIGYTVKPL